MSQPSGLGSAPALGRLSIYYMLEGSGFHSRPAVRRPMQGWQSVAVQKLVLIPLLWPPVLAENLAAVWRRKFCCTSASNRNEYHVYLLEGKVGRCVGWTTLPLSCVDFLKSGSLNLLEPSGRVPALQQGLLYLYLYLYLFIDYCDLFKTESVSNMEELATPYFRNSLHCQMF